MRLDNAIIEVTRKCNLKCEHCLRGCAENKNIKGEYLDMFLSKVKSIGTLTLSGGEPSINIEGLKLILSKLKQHKVRVDCFYLATNGKCISDKFISVLLDFYLYAEDKDACLVNVSNDYFHDIPYAEYSKLMGLSFVKEKYSGRRQINEEHILREGRADENCIGNRSPLVDPVKLEGEYVSGEVYLNCVGNIISGCDWSYASQEENYNIICKVEDFSKEAILAFNN